jgi:hypothetical protein
MNFTNYYEILGLQRNATQEKIKLAYRKLSLKFHPDQNQGDEFLAEMFKKINEANEILSNPEKRKNYDLNFSTSDNSDYQNTNYQYSPEINSSKIKELTNIYFEKDNIAKTMQRHFQTAINQSRPKNFTVSKVLGIIFIFFISYFIFTPNFNTKSTSDADSPNFSDSSDIWRTITYSEIYIKPNIKSEIIGNLESNENIKEIEQTKYFIKFEFTNSNGVSKIGYIRKLNVEKLQ